MSLEDVLSAHIVRPVYVGFLDILSDPVRAWTGPGSFLPVGTGDTDLDGQTFLHAGSVISITPFHDNQDIGSPVTVSMPAGDMEDEEIFQQLIVDKRTWLNRRAKFWEFYLAADHAGVLTDYMTLFDGVMTQAKTLRSPGEPSLISITCDVDTQKAFMAPTRYVDHSVLESGDTFSTYMLQLSRGPLSLPSGPTYRDQLIANITRRFRAR